jgi:hypothetical protein
MNLEIQKNINKENNENGFSKDLKNYIEKTETTYSIDRFEENFAVCENRTTNEMVNIEKKLLPENCKEGSIIKFENGKYVLDEQATKTEQEEIKNLVNNIFKRK